MEYLRLMAHVLPQIAGSKLSDLATRVKPTSQEEILAVLGSAASKQVVVAALVWAAVSEQYAAAAKGDMVEAGQPLCGFAHVLWEGLAVWQSPLSNQTIMEDLKRITSGTDLPESWQQDHLEVCTQIMMRSASADAYIVECVLTALKFFTCEKDSSQDTFVKAILLLTALIVYGREVFDIWASKRSRANAKA